MGGRVGRTAELLPEDRVQCLRWFEYIRRPFLDAVCGLRPPATVSETPAKPGRLVGVIVVQHHLVAVLSWVISH